MSELSLRKRDCIYLDAFRGHTEQNNALQAFLYERAEEFMELVDSPAALAWERRNGLGCILDVGDEDGVHQHRFCEVTPGLP
jgi:hypothetical protein